MKHSGRCESIELLYRRSAPEVNVDVMGFGQYRRDPAPHAGEALDWVTGLRTMSTAGDVNTRAGWSVTCIS